MPRIIEFATEPDCVDVISSCSTGCSSAGDSGSMTDPNAGGSQGLEGAKVMLNNMSEADRTKLLLEFMAGKGPGGTSVGKHLGTNQAGGSSKKKKKGPTKISDLPKDKRLDSTAVISLRVWVAEKLFVTHKYMEMNEIRKTHVGKDAGENFLNMTPEETMNYLECIEITVAKKLEACRNASIKSVKDVYVGKRKMSDEDLGPGGMCLLAKLLLSKKE